MVKNNFADCICLIFSYDETNSNDGEGEKSSWIVSRNGEENRRFRVVDCVSSRRHGERIKE